jgi:flagellar protein FlaJ
MNFAREAKSPTINRAIGLIAQAERAGGKIETVLESVALSVNQIETIKKERKASISNLVTQGYIIFIVFIVIMLVLEIKILPLITGIATPEGTGAPQTSSMDPDALSKPILYLLIIQSLFAGLVIGKLSEGSIFNGIKHSFILVALTLLATTGSKALFT